MYSSLPFHLNTLNAPHRAPRLTAFGHQLDLLGSLVLEQLPVACSRRSYSTDLICC
jgi:hypothetical protein